RGAAENGGPVAAYRLDASSRSHSVVERKASRARRGRERGTRGRRGAQQRGVCRRRRRQSERNERRADDESCPHAFIVRAKAPRGSREPRGARAVRYAVARTAT